MSVPQEDGEKSLINQSSEEQEQRHHLWGKEMQNTSPDSTPSHGLVGFHRVLAYGLQELPTSSLPVILIYR